MKSRKENIDAVDSVSTSMNNKLTVAESNISATVVNKLSGMQGELETALHKDAAQIKDSVELMHGKIEECTSFLQGMSASMTQLKVMAAIGIATGIAAIVVGVVL